MEHMQSITKRLNWINAIPTMQLAHRYIFDKWLWITPVLHPLQKYKDQVSKLETDVCVTLLKLYIPGWLHEDAALALHRLRRRAVSMLCHFFTRPSLFCSWVRRKWTYLGHVLRMADTAAPVIALRQGEIGTWRQQRPGPRGMFLSWAYSTASKVFQLQHQPSWEELRSLAMNREMWREASDKVVQISENIPHFAKPDSSWGSWRHPLVHAAKWALCIYLHVVHDGDLAVCTANWLDEQEGWQCFTMQVSMLRDFVRLLVGYVRMMGNWLVFQLLMCESAMQTCETELYVCCKSIFDSFEKIVVFEVVPDAWMTKVMERAM